MIRFKIDILKELKNKGYTTTKIRDDKIFSESTLTSIRNNKPVTTATLNTLCNILKRQPGALLEWIPDTEQKKETE